MAKPIIVSVNGIESSFDHVKLERSRLYGSRRRLPLDQDGATCVKAALTVDGLYLLQAGMTAQGYFDEQGRPIARNELVGLDADGQPLPLKPSTLGVSQPATVVDPSEVLRCRIESVYMLDPLAVDDALATRLQGGEVIRFGFNYGADYHEESAFLLRNPDGYFCLIGSGLAPVWSEAGKVEVMEATETASDDLDFEMF
jgi:hypothetical protein